MESPKLLPMLGGGHADEPEVDQVAQTGHDWVEEQAESVQTEKLLYSAPGNVVCIFICISLKFSYHRHELPSPKNWCLKLFKY